MGPLEQKYRRRCLQVRLKSTAARVPNRIPHRASAQGDLHSTICHAGEGMTCATCVLTPCIGGTMSSACWMVDALSDYSIGYKEPDFAGSVLLLAPPSSQLTLTRTSLEQAIVSVLVEQHGEK